MATKRIIDVLEALEHDSDESDVEIEYSDSECAEEVVARLHLAPDAQTIGRCLYSILSSTMFG